MSRRCKAGQRARIIGGGWNHGKIVLVVRPYFGEDIDGNWPLPLFPWVITSLGAPLRRRCLKTNIESPAKMMAVYDDCDLEPLDDDDDGLIESTDNERPVTTRAPAAGKEQCHG